MGLKDLAANVATKERSTNSRCTVRSILLALPKDDRAEFLSMLDEKDPLTDEYVYGGAFLGRLANEQFRKLGTPFKNILPGVIQGHRRNGCRCGDL